MNSLSGNVRQYAGRLNAVQDFPLGFAISGPFRQFKVGELMGDNYTPAVGLATSSGCGLATTIAIRRSPRQNPKPRIGPSLRTRWRAEFLLNLRAANVS